MKKTIITLLAAIATHLCATAQIPISDENLQDQLRSMETGPVGFSPQDYYMALHDNGLGRDGYSVYHWHLPTFSHLLGYWELSESRSKAKPLVEYYRTPRIALELLNKVYSKEELEQTQEQLEIETEEALDRQVDLAYEKYRQRFSDMQESIGSKLQYCLRVSMGEMLDHVSRISSMNEALCEEIQYVHKDITDGVGYDMPLAQREKEYLRIQGSMESILKATNMLVKFAVLNYDLKQ